MPNLISDPYNAGDVLVPANYISTLIYAINRVNLLDAKSLDFVPLWVDHVKVLDARLVDAIRTNITQNAEYDVGTVNANSLVLGAITATIKKVLDRYGEDSELLKHSVFTSFVENACVPKDVSSVDELIELTHSGGVPASAGALE